MPNLEVDGPLTDEQLAILEENIKEWEWGTTIQIRRELLRGYIEYRNTQLA